ncbi:Sucrase/ferredoxin-like-domain-containing protein [Gongronella butleri]|nr:Sucrase/ferredoxin-like-domain-containing protein [Gongronella butleri]
MASLLQKLSNAVLSDQVEIDQIPPSQEMVDCSGCAAPCDDHAGYPSYLDIDKKSDLLGSMKPYGRHLIIATGLSDWPEKIEQDKATLAAHLSQVIGKDKEYQAKQPNGRIFITNTSLHNQVSRIEGASDVIILPDNILVANVTPANAALFHTTFLQKPLPAQPVHLPDLQRSLKPSTPFVVQKAPYGSLILICSHRRRDKRCGITAPILAREFDHCLRQRDIEEQGEDGTAILMCSHVGGHKFAGNIICYTHQGTRGVWYGRVNPCHCEQIVDETIIQGKVIKDLYRGAMTHSYGPTEHCMANRLRW